MNAIISVDYFNDQLGLVELGNEEFVDGGIDYEIKHVVTFDMQVIRDFNFFRTFKDISKKPAIPTILSIGSTNNYWRLGSSIVSDLIWDNLTSPNRDPEHTTEYTEKVLSQLSGLGYLETAEFKQGGDPSVKNERPLGRTHRVMFRYTKEEKFMFPEDTTRKSEEEIKT